VKGFRYNKVITITILVALLSLIVGLVVLAQTKSRLAYASKEEYKKQQTILANQIADTLSNNIVNVQNQLRVMATMPEVKDIENVERCNSKLSELLEVNQRQLGNLGRTDPNGRFACSVNQAIIGQDSSRYGTYVQDLINDPKHMPVLSRMARPTGADTLATGLHVPVYDGDVFRGTLGGALYFSQFQDAYLRSIKFGNNGHVVLVDDNGDILYHPSKAQNGKNLLDPKILSFFEPQSTMRLLLKDVQSGKSGTFDYSVEGTQKAGLYKTFKLPDMNRHWAVVVTIPAEDLEHAVNQTGINTIFLVLVALFALTNGLLTFVSLRIISKNSEVQRMKDDFISITSHQLRTPATIVKQNLGLIKSGFVTDKKDINKFINSAYESNEDQLNIIESILSVSKLEAGRLEINKEPVVLQDLVGTLASKLKMNITSKGHKLRVNMPPKPIRLQADPTALTMAVENLVSNAVKYTPPGGHITIKVKKEDDTALVIVKDTGNGMSPEDISKLFLRFNRLHSAVTSHVPGTGLGLYLTKKIVELHSGTILVESQKHKGTTFTIKLPRD
jgi:signal transduction histidine kinase